MSKLAQIFDILDAQKVVVLIIQRYYFYGFFTDRSASAARSYATTLSQTVEGADCDFISDVM